MNQINYVENYPFLNFKHFHIFDWAKHLDKDDSDARIK